MPLAFRYFTAGSLACHAAAFLPVANRSLHCALQTFQIKDFGVFPKIWPRNPLSHFRTWKTANWGIPDCWTHHSSTAGSNAVETRHLNANQVPLEPRERLRGESTWTWQDKYDNDKFSKKNIWKRKKSFHAPIKFQLLLDLNKLEHLRQLRQNVLELPEPVHPTGLRETGWKYSKHAVLEPIRFNGDSDWKALVFIPPIAFRTLICSARKLFLCWSHSKHLLKSQDK